MVIHACAGTARAYDPTALPTIKDPIPVHVTIDGWGEADYQNYCDFEAAIKGDAPIEYALAQWLMRQEDNTTAFPGDTWGKWYAYARDHCSRFDKDQPRRRKGV
jgi:hypothetical protein